MNFIQDRLCFFALRIACAIQVFRRALLLGALFFFVGAAQHSLAQESSLFKNPTETVQSSTRSTHPIGAFHSVVTPAPDVAWQAGNQIEHLSSLRGKPVLILFTDTPLNHAFRHQLRKLKSRYEYMAAHGLICAVAFTKEVGSVPSNIPFITLLNGESSARAYGVSGSFGIALLGADGNLDCLSIHPLPGQRIADLMDASFTVQEALRKE
jgi:hypothetical protein